MLRSLKSPPTPTSIKRLLAVFTLLVLSLPSCTNKTEVVENIRPVRAMLLAATEQQVTAEYAGNVRPRVEARLGFRVNGKISTRKVDVGSLVKAGQVLMQLDPADLDLAQAQANGNLKAAKAAAQLADIDLKRYRALLETNAVSQSMLDAKVAALAAAQGNLEQAQAISQGQSNQADYANLVATSKGVVTAIHAEVGQVVSAGMPVIQIAQLDEMEVEVGIPENNVELVSRASLVKIHLWADAKETITGKIREISPVADPATRTFTARISIIDPSPKVMAMVKMGMTATVQFGLESQGSFVKVPLTALFQEKGNSSVWIVEKGSVNLVPVRVVGVSGNDVLLSATAAASGPGVVAGQMVVTAGVHLLKPGQRVTILEAPAKPEEKNEPPLTIQTLLIEAVADKSLTRPSTAK